MRMDRLVAVVLVFADADDAAEVLGDASRPAKRVVQHLAPGDAPARRRLQALRLHAGNVRPAAVERYHAPCPFPDPEAQLGDSGHCMAVDDVGPPFAKRLSEAGHEGIAAFAVEFRDERLRHRPPGVDGLEPEDVESVDGFAFLAAQRGRSEEPHLVPRRPLRLCEVPDDLLRPAPVVER